MVTLADLLAEPEDEPDADWFCEPRDKLPASEFDRQRSFLTSMARLAPGVVVWAVPNEGKRTLWERGRAKALGLRKGMPDIGVAWNNGVAFIEMKGGQTAISKSQREVLNMLFRQGHHVAVFRTPALALDWLRSIGCPVREARF